MLTVANATKTFGGLTAVDDASLSLGRTGITGLVGPNGSGKTTLFHMITGFYPLDKGEIHYRDVLISRLPPHAINRAGLIRTFQQTRVLPFMTTRENLLAAAPDQSGERLFSIFFQPAKIRREETRNRDKAKEILKRIQLAPLADELAGRLSYGQQKLLELGRVLMSDPRLILLDEPTAGVNPALIRQLVEIITGLVEKGIQIFLIEHNMPLVAELCEKVFVMDSGSLIFSGSPRDAMENDRVIEAYLGRTDHAA